MNEFRALLLTDVVDSTQLSERLGDEAMAEVWAAHDRVARDLLPQWRGREIDKTDGMLLLFDAAADAVPTRWPITARWPRCRAAEGARRPARRSGDPAREQLPTTWRAAPSRSRWTAWPSPPRRASCRWRVAARRCSRPRHAKTLGDDRAQPAIARALADQGRGRTYRAVRGRRPGGRAFIAPSDSDKVFRVVRSRRRWLPVQGDPEQPAAAGHLLPSAASARSTRSRPCSARPG